MAFITFDVIIDTLTQDINDVVREVFEEKNKIATGKTVDSTQVNFEITSDGFNFETTIGEGAPYIVSGREAGSTLPPPAPIAEWLAAKGVPYDLNDVRYAIARDGIEPVDIETPILDGIEQVFEQEYFTQAISNSIGRTLTLAFTK
jgi:hypothetical protein